MASRNQILKGITIPVGADTSGFLAAYKDMDDTCKAIGREVKSLEAALKLEYDNTKFLQAQEANQRYLDETKKKAEYLRAAINDVMKGNAADKNEKLQVLNTDLQYTQNTIKKTENHMRDLDKVRFDSIQNSFKDTNAILDVSKAKAELLRDRLDIKFDKNTVAEFQKAAQEQIEKTLEKLSRLKKVMDDLAKDDPDIKLTKEFKELENQVISLENELKKVPEQLKEIDRMRLDEIKAQFDSVGDTLIGISKAIAPVSIAISGALGVGVKSAMDFEVVLADLREIIGAKSNS